MTNDEYDQLPPEAKLTITTRNLILDGKSVYGAPDSRLAVEKLAELDARIAYGKQQGYIPEEKAWTAERVAEEKVAREYPLGVPAIALPEHTRDYILGKLEHLATLPEDRLATLVARTKDDFGNHISQGSISFSRYDPATGAKPTGAEIHAALLAYAAPVIAASAKSPEDVPKLTKAVAADRTTLELLAARGAAVARYAASRQAKGLKP